MSSYCSGHSLLSIARANRLRATANSEGRRWSLVTEPYAGPFVTAPVSARLPLVRWWDEDRGQIHSLRAVGVARAAVVAFVQGEGGSSDDGSEGNRNRD